MQSALREVGLDEVPSHVHLLQSHGDAVFEMPEGAELLASSAITPVEIFTLGDGILGLQGHPEFCPAVIQGELLL